MTVLKIKSKFANRLYYNLYDSLYTSDKETAKYKCNNNYVLIDMLYELGLIDSNEQIRLIESTKKYFKEWSLNNVKTLHLLKCVWEYEDILQEVLGVVVLDN